MAGFNNHGVPWYAHPKTPAVRPRELPKSNDPNWRASRMAAYQYVRSFVKENWKVGDRFVFTKQSKRDERSRHGGQSGFFKELKLCGSVWWVVLEWEDKTYKPNTGNRVGMFDFYHFAFKIPQNAVEFPLCGFEIQGVTIDTADGPGVVVMQMPQEGGDWYPILLPLEAVEGKLGAPTDVHLPFWTGEPILPENCPHGWRPVGE